MQPTIINKALTTLPITKVSTKTFAFTQVLLVQSEKFADKIVSCFLCLIRNAQTSFAKAIHTHTILVIIPALIHTLTLRYLAVRKTSHTPTIITIATINPVRIPSKSPE